MKKNNGKKLSLFRETLRRLSSTELGQVAGGAWSDDSVCPTTRPSKHGYCQQDKEDGGNGNGH
jgi:hypothetical protein